MIDIKAFSLIFLILVGMDSEKNVENRTHVRDLGDFRPVSFPAAGKTKAASFCVIAAKAQAAHDSV